VAWQVLRSVIEDLDVSVYVDMFADRYPRFNEAWEGLKWLLSRSPTVKGSVSQIGASGEYRSYVLAGDLLAETPEIWVVYTYNENEVRILGLNAIAAPDEDA